MPDLEKELHRQAQSKESSLFTFWQHPAVQLGFLGIISSFALAESQNWTDFFPTEKEPTVCVLVLLIMIFQHFSYLDRRDQKLPVTLDTLKKKPKKRLRYIEKNADRKTGVKNPFVHQSGKVLN